MGFDKLSELMREAERAAVAAGVPAADAARILLGAEESLTKALIASNRAERQLLLGLKERGATELARERGCSRAQIYRLRSQALNKLSTFAAHG